MMTTVRKSASRGTGKGGANSLESRLPQLDGFRAIAVLLVMISHAGLEHIVPGGLGVTIFFFLSGYLITSIMVHEWSRTGQLSFRKFYLRRTVRIIPPMLIAIGFTVMLSVAGLIATMNYPSLGWDVLFLTNYATQLGTSSMIPIPLWSLDVEEHFYLAFPLLFVFVRGKWGPASAVAVTCAALCIVVLGLRIAHVAANGPGDEIYYWSHTRIDSILYGCILATWNNPTTEDRVYISGQFRYAVIGVVIIFATIAFRDPVFRQTVRYSLQGLGLFLIFNYAIRNRGFPAKILSNRILKYVADRSYFLYLIHFPLYKALPDLSVSPFVRYGAAIVASFLLAEIVRQLVERPLLRWRQNHELKADIKVSTI
jgi:peptidoglycan/LPS O-acetylase OafA/YrhL